MSKILLLGGIFVLLSLIHPIRIAAVGENASCAVSPDNCYSGFRCNPTAGNPGVGTCVRDPFGKIQPPAALIPFLQNDTTGAKGISKFLSNLVALIYTMSAIAVVFMLVWGAFDWLTSGGNKEQLERARNRIINAIIGILLLAAAFAILDVLHIFTGFEFFQGPPGACIVNGQNICGRR